MECEHVRELLEGHAAGALDRRERAAVERHLERCPDCRDEALALAAATHRLPEALGAASALELPPTLRVRVIERAVREGAETAASRPSRLRALAARPRTLVALAGVLVAVVAVTWAVDLQFALARERDRRAQLAQLVGKQDVVFEVVDSRETRKAFLRSTGGRFAESYGKLYTRPDLPDVVAFAARLPRASEGRAYHLWLTRDGRTRLAGVLTVRDGFGLLVLRSDRRGPAYQSAELTLQPHGATRPGGARVLSWSEGSAS